jgi:hypothetical protein
VSLTITSAGSACSAYTDMLVDPGRSSHSNNQHQTQEPKTTIT